LADLPTLDGWTIGRTIDAPGDGMEIVDDEGNLWVINVADRGFTNGVANGQIYKIDPASMTIVKTVEHATGGFPAIGAGAMWLITSEFGEAVLRVDMDTQDVELVKTSTTEDPAPEAVAVAGGYVWVGNNHDGTVAQVDPETLEVVKTIPLTEPGEWGVRGQAATDGDSVWFGISRTGEIVRIDAATAKEVSRITLPNVPHDSLPEWISQAESSPPETLLVLGDQLWASTVDHIYAIDTSEVGNEKIVADIPTGEDWDSKPVADDAGNIWAIVYSTTNPAEAIGIVQIDTSSRAPVGIVPLTGIPGGRLAVTEDAAYIRTEGKLFEIQRP